MPIGTPSSGSSASSANTPIAGAADATKVIGIAEGQIGQYSSVNKFNSWYGLPGSEWCDEFVSWCFDQAGAISAIGGKFAYTVAHAKWFQSQGRFSATAGQSGDLVFFDWSGGRSVAGISHVGIVKAVNSDGTVSTIEGNTGNNQVASRQRAMSNIAGFGTPNISGLGAAQPAGYNPAGLNPLGALAAPFQMIEKVASHLVDPVFWKRVGLFGLGLLVVALGIAFFNRKKIETRTKTALELAALA
jgi:hypothetical protein